MSSEVVSSINVCFSQFAETPIASSEVSGKEEHTYSGGYFVYQNVRDYFF